MPVGVNPFHMDSYCSLTRLREFHRLESCTTYMTSHSLECS